MIKLLFKIQLGIVTLLTKLKIIINTKKTNKQDEKWYVC